MKGKVVLITGASSGIGEATARLLADRRARVVMGARRLDRLDKIASELTSSGKTALARKLDVTNLDDMKTFVEFARAKFGRVDVVVNNAGVMPLSPIEALKIDEWNQMIDVNIRGVLHGIAAALPLMKKQKEGHFINLSSIGGHQVWPTCAVYCATKFAVIAISEGLRQENRDIRVTIISPGVTTSELASTITDPEAKKSMKEFREVSMPASAIAHSIAFAIEQPPEVSISEIIARPTASAF